MPDTFGEPKAGNPDFILEILNIPFYVKIRQIQILDYGTSERIQVTVFHISIFPLITAQQYETWFENADKITEMLIEQVAQVRQDVGQFAMINMVDWFEFIQY